MAGLPTAFSAPLVELGPGNLWLAAELPATGAVPVTGTAVAGGVTPDATASAGAIHMGYTQEGSVLSYEPNIQVFEADESTAPIISALVGEPSKIEGRMMQTLDTNLLLKLMPGGTRTAAAGHERITWGGLQVIPTFTVFLIAPIYADPTKIIAVMLYKAYNASGFTFNISRKAVSTVPYSFVAMTIPTRPAGDQIGLVYKTIP